MEYFLIFAGFGISLSNLLDLIAYFRRRKSCTVIPFFGGLFLMLGVNIAYPAAARFWYLFLMMDVSFFIMPYMLISVIVGSVYKYFVKNK